ncbi:MAG: DUF397 domain-containing protein [Nocardiopsaceae bacterium]|nr:DUF397 domain-containing protein [Nocardiopsaceae bacterium]
MDRLPQCREAVCVLRGAVPAVPVQGVRQSLEARRTVNRLRQRISRGTIGAARDAVVVRDTKNRDAGALRVPPGAWRAFVAALNR